MNRTTTASPPALRMLEKRVRRHQLPPLPEPAPVAWWARWLSRLAFQRR